MAAGIPTVQGAEKRYEFRAGFLNGGNVPGQVQTPFNNISNDYSYDFSLVKGTGCDGGFT